MPITQVYNPRQSRTLDGAVTRIEVVSGAVVLIPPQAVDHSTHVTLAAGQSKDFDPPLAGLTVSSRDSARIAVTYELAEHKVKVPRARAGRRRATSKQKAKRTAGKRG